MNKNTKIKFDDFENICRTCLSTTDLKQIDDNNIIGILQFLSSTIYSRTDELPQKLCAKCIKTMTNIQKFAFKCKETHLALTNCFIDSKRKKKKAVKDNINKVEFIDIKQQVVYEPNVRELLTDPLEKNECEQMIPKHEIKIEETNLKEEETITEDISERTNEEIISTNTNTNTNTKTKSYSKQLKGMRSFDCNFCNKSFPSADRLRRHKMMHIEIRPFNCDICSKIFRKSYDLKAHLKTHGK